MGGSAVASGSEAVALGIGAVASGNAAMALGQATTAAGDSSMALGFGAVTTAAADGSFVFADRSPGGNFTSFAPNQFLAKATGGVGFYTNSASTTGVELAPNGSSWASLSDVNAKENFRDVDGEGVLTKLAAMSIQEWNYKAQDIPPGSVVVVPRDPAPFNFIAFSERVFGLLSNLALSAAALATISRN